jgi:hypothetical protein
MKYEHKIMEACAEAAPRSEALMERFASILVGFFTGLFVIEIDYRRRRINSSTSWRRKKSRR